MRDKIFVSLQIFSKLNSKSVLSIPIRLPLFVHIEKFSPNPLSLQEVIKPKFKAQNSEQKSSIKIPEL